jgi:hypothetical protein
MLASTRSGETLLYRLAKLLLLLSCNMSCTACGPAGSLKQLKLGFSGFWRHQYNKLQPASFEALGHLTGDAHQCKVAGRG